MVAQPDGSSKRVQTYYAARDKAEAELAKAKAKRRQHGRLPLSLSEDERIDFPLSTVVMGKAFAPSRHTPLNITVKIYPTFRF